MKKTLRLLVTKDCPNNCALCCNKNFDLEKLPIVQHFDYDEVIITGGEPFLDKLRDKVISLINYLTYVDVNPNRKLFAYTSLPGGILSYYHLLDGITLSLHTQKDLKRFLTFNKILFGYNYVATPISLRLKVFEGVTLPKDVDLSIWQVTENIQWIENCPLPTNEVFMRLKNI